MTRLTIQGLPVIMKFKFKKSTAHRNCSAYHHIAPRQKGHRPAGPAKVPAAAKLSTTNKRLIQSW